MNVHRQVCKIVAETSGKTDYGVWSPSFTLDYLGIDSLDRFDMVIKIEEQFSIDIEQEAIVAWNTVQDVIDTVVNLTIGMKLQLSSEYGKIGSHEFVGTRVCIAVDGRHSVRLRNGDICDKLQPYDATDYKLTAIRRKDGHMLTWTEYGRYNVDCPEHEWDIVETLA